MNVRSIKYCILHEMMICRWMYKWPMEFSIDFLHTHNHTANILTRLKYATWICSSTILVGEKEMAKEGEIRYRRRKSTKECSLSDRWLTGEQCERKAHKDEKFVGWLAYLCAAPAADLMDEILFAFLLQLEHSIERQYNCWIVNFYASSFTHSSILSSVTICSIYICEQ